MFPVFVGCSGPLGRVREQLGKCLVILETPEPPVGFRFLNEKLPFRSVSAFFLLEVNVAFERKHIKR